LTAKPVRAYLSDIAGLAPSTRKRKRARHFPLTRWLLCRRRLPRPGGVTRQTVAEGELHPTARGGRRRLWRCWPGQ
jgi:hypothetical protein